MKPTVLEPIIADLCTQAGLPPPVARTPIRVWQMSGVERLHFADAGTVVVKYAGPPFTGEAAILRSAAKHGVPVPHVIAAQRRDDLLVMLLEDLGDRLHEPTDHDGAAAAARLHRADIDPAQLEVWNADRLAALPSRMIDLLSRLHEIGRLRATKQLIAPLQQLARHAVELVDGAETLPFGLVHGELHPTSLHIGASGWRLVDFAMAHVGPGLLDLATWQGTRQPPDIERLQHQMHAYIAARGSTTVLQPRGGLPAAKWALGWHRLWSADWLLRQVTTAPEDTEEETASTILRRQIGAAAAMLIRPNRRTDSA